MTDEQAKDGHRLGLILASFMFVVFVSAVGIVFYVDEQSDDRAAEIAVLAKENAQLSKVTDYLLCIQNKTNREAIRRVAFAGDPTLLKPGDYGYSYAQAHPAEAAEANARIQSGETEALRAFPPIKCPPDPRPKE